MINIGMNLMRTLKILAASVLLVSGMTVKSFAGASDFSGIYLGVSGGAIGAAIDGDYTDGTSNGRVAKGTAGAVSGTVGAEGGFSFSLNDTAFLSVNMTSPIFLKSNDDIWFKS